MKSKSGKIKFIFIVYWVMLAYIIAALVWWFIALYLQNMEMAKHKINDIDSSAVNYNEQTLQIRTFEKRKNAQYIGEGITFLLLIAGSAIYIFRAARRQLRQSEQQQHFMMAISHELKTPVAVSKLNLETILKRNLDEATLKKLIENTLQETNRLNSLCNNLLLASQMETGYSRTIEILNISELLENSVDEFKNKYPSREFLPVMEREVFIKGDNLMLQLLFSNLLDNAVKYSKSKIYITLNSSSKTCVIKITDEGAGIPEEEKNKIFEKNYRMGNIATKSAKGTGLGLYLTKKIVIAHKGKIEVFNNESGGAVFSLELPLV